MSTTAHAQSISAYATWVQMHASFVVKLYPALFENSAWSAITESDEGREDLTI